MIVQNINSKQKSRGFTIVELLVVIVVIGILAAITIVSYTGITQKANTTKALSNAQSVQNVAEVYAAELNIYPATAATFAAWTTGSTRLPAGITVISGLPGTAGAFSGTDPLIALTAANKLITVTWACLTTCTNTTGGRITYWDFTTAAQSLNTVYVGAGTSAGTYVAS